jgi:hypothetical protein
LRRSAKGRCGLIENPGVGLVRMDFDLVEENASRSRHDRVAGSDPTDHLGADPGGDDERSREMDAHEGSAFGAAAEPGTDENIRIDDKDV